MRNLLLMGMTVVALAAPAFEFRPSSNPDDQYRFGWYFPPDHYEDYLNAGVNLMIWCYDSHWYYEMSDERRLAETSRHRRWIERFARDKVDYIEQVKAVDGLNRARRDLHVTAPKSAGLDLSREDTQAQLRKTLAESAATCTNLTAFVGVQPTTEVTLCLSLTPAFTAACERANGFLPPPEWTDASDRLAWRKPGFPLSGVVPEGDRALKYFTWLHREGNGYNRYMDACAAIYRKALGRPLFQWYDPVTRVHPLWGAMGGRNLDVGSQWYYAQLAPFGVSFVIGEEMAMMRQRPDTGVFVMLQGFCYQDYAAPRKRAPKNPPDWFVRDPDRNCITMPGDLLVEAQWAIFSRKIEGYGVYEQGAFYPSRDRKRNKAFTNDKAFSALCDVWRRVGVPLGPLFRAVPERPPEVVLVRSHASSLLAGRSCNWGWGSSEGDMLTGANMAPYVIYEDEIRRDGIPPTAKVVILSDCPALTETTAKAVHAFQDHGGVLVANEWTAPDFLADVMMPAGLFSSYNRTMNCAGHRKALDRVGRELRARLAWAYEPYADSANEDLVVHARTYRKADYVFAINDRRVCGDYVGQWGVVEEKGMPNEGVVTVARTDTAAVYDLARHAEIPFAVRDGKTRIPVSYVTCDGKALLVVPRKLGALAVRRRSGGEVEVSSGDADVMIPIEVVVDGGKPRYGVVENGIWKRPYAKGTNLRVTNLADGRVFGL